MKVENIKVKDNVNFSGKQIQTITPLRFGNDTFSKETETAEKPHKYYVNLSKNISYALRHNPKGCHLDMDTKGYVAIAQLLAYLNSTGEWNNLTQKDIEDTISKIEKKRFEINGENIRAYYGHSFADKIMKEPSTPPQILYHGTSKEAAEKILKEGLNPQNRQYVHLSSDIETAKNVGLRKDKKPIILVVNSKNANIDGIKFYIGNQKVWLSDNIPPEYIKVL